MAASSSSTRLMLGVYRVTAENAPAPQPAKITLMLANPSLIQRTAPLPL
jgi:hypothetical protein